ncbi:MAG: glycosyltransferase [Acidimicrobiia bacterium]|nr:glycosyltransferase [Acidimicrobiia bacterium]
MDADRTRIVHVVTRYLRGGSEQRIRDLISSLPDAEHIVVVGANSDLDLAVSQLGLEPKYERALVRAPNPITDLLAIARITRLLRRSRADLVVTHQSKAGVVGRIAAFAAGRVPAVHSLSMANFGPGYGRVEDYFFRSIERALAPITCRYAVVGADLARRFERAGVPGHKLRIVRSAARLPQPRIGNTQTFPGIPDGRPVVLHLGALEPRKNVLSLVPLLGALITRVDPVRPFLAIAGEGPQAGLLTDEFRAAGLEGDVAFLGYTHEVDLLLHRSSALVLLSNAEGLPQVLMQAAAAGIPFVTTDVDGAHELLELGARGEIIDLGDTDAAAEALDRFLRLTTTPARAADLSSWSIDVVQNSYRMIISDSLNKHARAS